MFTVHTRLRGKTNMLHLFGHSSNKGRIIINGNRLRSLRVPIITINHRQSNHNQAVLKLVDRIISKHHLSTLHLLISNLQQRPHLCIVNISNHTTVKGSNISKVKPSSILRTIRNPDQLPAHIHLNLHQLPDISSRHHRHTQILMLIINHLHHGEGRGCSTM